MQMLYHAKKNKIKQNNFPQITESSKTAYLELLK